MIKCFIICFMLICTLTFSLSAQEPPPIRAIPLPTGSGARALGQGGAFIGIAGDATAASWNPAGLTWLEKPEFSFVGAFLTTDQDFSVDNDPDLKSVLTIGDEDVSRFDLNFMSLTYPFIFLDRKVVATLNYHQIYDFHMDLSLDIAKPDKNQQIDFKSSGGIGALSHGFACLLIPNVSLGFTLNIYDDEFYNSHGWTESTALSGQGEKSSEFFRLKTSSRDYHGINASIGVQWDIWKEEEKRLTFGAVFNTPYTARFDQVSKGFTLEIFKDGRIPSFGQLPSESRVQIDWPMSIGAGLGFRYSDALSFAFDITWTDWSEWVENTKTSGSATREESRPIGGGSEHDEIDDTFAARFGTEYLWFKEKSILAFRGGLFYEPRPSLGNPTEFNESGRPIDFDGDPTDVWGFSLGAGFSTDKFSLDAAYQFRLMRDMEGNDIGLPGTDFDAVENLFLTSLIVYF